MIKLQEKPFHPSARKKGMRAWLGCSEMATLGKSVVPVRNTQEPFSEAPILCKSKHTFIGLLQLVWREG